MRNILLKKKDINYLEIFKYNVIHKILIFMKKWVNLKYLECRYKYFYKKIRDWEYILDGW